jgi:hypothetical protein
MSVAVMQCCCAAVIGFIEFIELLRSIEFVGLIGFNTCFRFRGASD